MGPLEREIEDLLERPVAAQAQGWAQADGHPPDAEERVLLSGLSDEQRDEYLLLRVSSLGDALLRIAQEIDEMQGTFGGGED